jgi:hypothetical protein
MRVQTTPYIPGHRLSYLQPLIECRVFCPYRAWRSTPGSEPLFSPPLGSRKCFSARVSKPTDPKLTFPRHKDISEDQSDMISGLCFNDSIGLYSHATQYRNKEITQALRLDRNPRILEFGYELSHADLYTPQVPMPQTV